jgi:hypothetical protein
LPGSGNARHPLSQSLLDVLEANLVWLVYTPDLAALKEDVKDAKRLRVQATVLIKQLQKERKHKEATEAGAIGIY